MDLAARRRRLSRVMRRLRAGAISRLNLAVEESPPVLEPAEPVADPAQAIQLPKTSHPTLIERKNRYRLADFLDHHDGNFVRNAYIGLLGREPDMAGWDHNVEALRRGSRSKVEILGRIRYSSEGRNRGVRVTGLALPFAMSCLYRVPVLGYLVRFPVALLRLPENSQGSARLEAYVNSRVADLETAIDTALGTTERILKNLDESQAGVRLRGDELQQELVALSREKADEVEVEGLQSKLRYVEQEMAPAENLEALVGRVDSLVGKTVDRESHAKLALQLGKLAESTPRRAAFEELLERVESLAGESVDRESHVKLALQLGELADSTPRRAAFEELLHRVDEVNLRAVDRESHERLSHQLAALQESSAGRDVVESISQRLDESLRHSVDRSAHDRLAGELSEMSNSRVAQVQLDEAVRRLEEQLQAKADQYGLDAAAGDLRDAMAVSKGEQERHLEARVGEIRGEVEAATSQEASRSEVRFGSVQKRLDELDERSRAQRMSIIEEQRKFAALLEATRKRLPKPLTRKQLEGVVAEEAHARDANYSEFEDRFRGTREEIKTRVRDYLPIVSAAIEATRGAPVLDLGCGRGEWLEVLEEEGRSARGVDANRVMVHRCQEQGLDVEEGDALEFLRKQKASSHSVISGIHIIEHLPFDQVILIFAEALRVLRRGGIAIFETPNPENLFVGACGFYADPSHRNPLFPPTMEFVLREQGFEDVEILRPERGQDPDLFRNLPDEDPLALRLNPILGVLKSAFGASPDFAVVGRKA